MIQDGGVHELVHLFTGSFKGSLNAGMCMNYYFYAVYSKFDTFPSRNTSHTGHFTENTTKFLAKECAQYWLTA